MSKKIYDSNDDPGAVIHITIVPHGFEVEAYVGGDVPGETDSSAFTCRDFSGNVDTTVLAATLYDEIVRRLQDGKFVDRFDPELREEKKRKARKRKKKVGKQNVNK